MAEQRKIVHKLLITYKAQSKYHKTLLLPMEVANGLTTGVILTVANIGDNDFPGGTAKYSYKLQTGVVSGYEVTDSEPYNIPRLRPKESTQINVEINALSPGIHTIQLRVEPYDKTEIEFYQDPPPLGEPIRGSWIHFIYSFNRVELDIAELLNEMAKKR